MPPKRRIRNVFEDDDEDPSSNNAPTGGTPPKKPRPDSRPTAIHRAGIAPPPVAQNGGSGGDNSIQAQVAVAKARAQVLMSAMQNRNAAAAPALSSSMPARPVAGRDFAPVNAGSNGAPTVGQASSVTARSVAGSGSGSGAGAGATSIQAQLEAARAKVQAQMAALQAKNKPPSTPAPASSSATNAAASTSTSTATTPSASFSKAPTAIHPLLLSNSLAAPSTSTAASSSSSTSSSYVKPRWIAPELNPYLQASRQAASELSRTASTSAPKQRSLHKPFQFHKPGRHIREAEELRHEQQLEEIKRRIEESARKAAAAEGIEAGDEKRLLRGQPPDIEWWDVNLVASRSYSPIPIEKSIEDMLEDAKVEGNGVLLWGKDSPIDHYVQHPIPIAAPSDKFEVKPKGLILTKKEQRKLRRQRRAAEQSDKRDRIKMGLLPQDPPKVKLSNLMRVLTSEAVSDPTKVEARVRREIAARKEAHERQNAEKKLTDEERREKIERSKEKEQQKGLYCAVFKIKHLVSGRHKFKVSRNAQDHGMTGVCVFARDMAVVVVEGSGKAIKAYKRLMCVRIDWSDPGEPLNDGSGDEDAGEGKGAGGEDGRNSNNTPLGGAQAGFRSLTTSQENIEWSSNFCQLIFEGPIRERVWQARGFRAVSAPTDEKAREVLGHAGMQGYWDLARRVGNESQDTL
ncbi:related to PRP3 - essential splicing factor [Ustilago sp. UG-2017b]|nr:related to PRP3 - essential splicing factor [Ustilago sp. UG-2017b]